MKTLLITILILFLSGHAFTCQGENGSDLRYNPMNGSWSYESSRDDLKYNVMEDNWSYEAPDSELKYNPMEDRWEYAE